MTKEEILFDQFFEEVTGITDINEAELSPGINLASVKQMDVRKSIGNINIIQGNIRSNQEAQEVIEEFLDIEIP